MEPIKEAGAAVPTLLLRRFRRDAGEHDHRQLYRLLQGAIHRGELVAGLRLPPTRTLAAALGIARNTVVHVYEQLALEGYVQAGVGRGTFVAGDEAPRLDAAPALPAGREPGPAGAPMLSSRGRRLVGEAAVARRQWGAFAPGVPEVRLFPSTVWNRLHARCWRRAGPEHLTYGDGAGLPALREAIAQYLQEARGVACGAEQVLVTSGTHQSMHLIAQVLTDAGERVWLEDPGYWGARSVLRAHGLRLEAVAVDDEGLAPSAAQFAAPPRLMFVSPSHQYPLGSVMSHGRRRQLLDYAGSHGTWIVEDDYDSEFRYGARPLPALQGLDDHGRVLYLGTFSKTLFPALRLGYIVVPPALAAPMAVAAAELYREGPTMQQAVLAAFIAEGHYATHVRRMRGVYRARHDTLIDAIAATIGTRLPVIGGDAGLHLVLGLPGGADDRALVRAALAAGVVTRPLSMYHLAAADDEDEAPPRGAVARGLLLGYGAVEEDEIVRATQRLSRALQREGPAHGLPWPRRA